MTANRAVRAATTTKSSVTPATAHVATAKDIGPYLLPHQRRAGATRWARRRVGSGGQPLLVRRVERSGGLPQLDPIALRIGDPAEPADTLHALRLVGHVRSLGAQLREHRVQVADPEVEHGLLGAGPEVAGIGLERREHRQPGSLTPQAVLIG